MTPEDAAALVAEVRRHRCETDAVEAKAARGGLPTTSFRQSLSAFANRVGGGVVLLGLDEDAGYEPVGVSNPHQIQDVVVNAANDVEPPLRPDITVVEVEGRPVVAVEIPELPAIQKPCFVRAAGMQHGSYIRVGASNRKMTPYEVFIFASVREQVAYDATPVDGATMADLDPAAFARYVDLLRQRDPRPGAKEETDLDILRRVGVLGRGAADPTPTLAGLLVFGRNPQQFAPQLMLAVVQFFGIDEDEPAPDGARFVDNRQFEGPLPEALDAAIQRVLTNMRTSSLIRGILREDIPEYPAVAVREAIVNAVVHRDYSHFGRGSHVQVRLFADRLEIRSPGGLFGNVTEETLDEAQSTRNAVLVRLLQDLGYVENRGSGVREMIAAMRRANLEPPVFEDQRTAFKVTFRNHTLMNPEAIGWLNRFGTLPLNERQRLALVFVRQRGRLTNGDYRRLNRVDSPTATRELKEMVTVRAIEQQGAYGGAYYTLLLPAASAPALTEDERVIDFVAAHGSIDNAQCRALLGITARRTAYLLGRLVREGRLVRIGSRRWSRYRLPGKDGV